MNKFRNNLVPPVFDTFLKPVTDLHEYNTRFSSNQSFPIPKVRTNYRIFNIRFQGAKIWNSLTKNIKFLSIDKFKKNVKENFIHNYLV